MEASERQILAREAVQMGVSLRTADLDRLDVYADLLCTWNRRVRLLGDRRPETLIQKHIPDCLALAPLVSAPGPLADLGSGAGLPGLILACIYPELECWLVESRRKRANFLQEAKVRLGLDRVTVIEARAETLSADSSFAGRARYVTARAIPAQTLVSLGAPLLRVGGQVLLMESRRHPTPRVDAVSYTHLTLPTILRV